MTRGNNMNLLNSQFTQQEIYNALHAKSGSTKIKYRFDLIRNNAVISHVPASGSVSLNRTDKIKRTARFEIYGECGIDWLKDYIRPVVLIGMEDKKSIVSVAVGGTWANINARARTWEEIHEIGATWEEIAKGEKKAVSYEEQYAEFPLGVFLLASPSKEHSAEGVVYSVDAYDKTLILSEDCITSRVVFEEGEKYTDVIESLIAGSGLQQVVITPSDTILPAQREFDIGTSRLDIINTLLSEIIYNELYADENGIIIVSPYTEPSEKNISMSYVADELSIISTRVSTDLDTYGVPNVFIATVSNPELGTDLSATYINDNPTSKLSTIYRGRKIVSELYKPDYISSQKDLEAYIRRIAFEANQVQERITFETAIMPTHGISEVMEINHPCVSGIFVEDGWTIDLVPDGKMSHEGSRLVLL